MGIPRNKADLIKAIKTTHASFDAELNSIKEAEAQVVELPGHGKDTLMNVHNLLAYLVGWGELVLKWEANKSNGIRVDFPETGFKWNQLGELAKKFYKDYEDLTFAQLREKLKAVVSKILTLVSNNSNRDLYEVDWYDRYSLGRMIQLNTSSPYKNARSRLRRWKSSKAAEQEEKNTYK